jgi:hypothetical protein
MALPRRSALLFALLPSMLLWPAAQAAPAATGPAAPWLLTLLDGEAVVIDGTRRVTAAPGVALAAGALVETSERTALLRLEGPNAASIDLGPATRAMLAPPAQASRGGRVPALYLLQGWAKLTSRGTTPITGFVTPALDGGGFDGAVVLRVAGGEHSAFAESAALELSERRSGGAPVRLSIGQHYRSGGPAGAVSARPDPAWLSALPRAFRDTIPLRAAAFKDRPVVAENLPTPAYEQLAHWLAAEPYVRRDFTQRFAPLLRDAAFRRGVQKNLAAHPEWGSLLAPKDPPR